ncbi:MAG: YtxH domain-containing protein [Bacteroidota bacterium]
MNTGKILVGLLAGAAAGAALGVLLSPEKGSKTIRKVKSTKEKYSENIKEGIVNFLFALINKISTPKVKEEESSPAK